jgi:hypothetical protein
MDPNMYVRLQGTSLDVLYTPPWAAPSGSNDELPI